jgi:SAM-dependent methyltransferase
MDAAAANEAAVAAGYDRVYATAAASARLQELWRPRAGGPDFPADAANISFLTAAELRDAGAALDLGPGDLLCDLACGAGGPGLWVAAQSGCRLVGVDLSAEGIAAATARAAALGLQERATFHVGSFAATGLTSASVDGILTVDALQYAPDKAAAYAEMARILRPGQRAFIAVFEVDADRVHGVPVLSDDAVADHRPLLQATGFTVDAYEESAGWRERVRSAYGAVLDAEGVLRGELGDEAFDSLALEMTLTLQLEPYPRRVLIAATRR